MFDFYGQWFQDVPKLIAKTDEVYVKLQEIGKPNKWAATQKKIIENRGWQESLPLVGKNFESVLKTLNIFYLPKAQDPGPAFVFPIKDLNGRWNQAQVRPSQESLLFLPDHKYRRLGGQAEFLGPPWIGNDPETIQRIIESQDVTLVEGPFDVLACRLLDPTCTVMSTGTKGLSEEHADYLHIIGIKTLNLLFDNESSGQGGKGADKTEFQVSKKWGKTFAVVQKQCPATDPSNALRKVENAERLKKFLALDKEFEFKVK